MGLTPTKETVTTLEDRSWLGSQHGTDSTYSKTLDGDSVRTKFAAGTFIPSGVVLAHSTADAKARLYAGTSEEAQLVTEGGSGLTSFTLTFDGQTTGAIAAGATAAAVQTALEALSNVAPGDVAVTGVAGGPFTVTFGGAYLNTDVPQMTATPTGGTGTVTVTTATAGGADQGSAGTGVAKGFLFSGQIVPATGDLHVAVLSHGAVVRANLPANSGLDPAAEADLTHIRFR